MTLKKLENILSIKRRKKMILIKIKDEITGEHSFAVVTTLEQYTRDTTMRFSQGQLNDLKEQIKVTTLAWLDRETGEIKNVTAKEQKLSELLENYYQLIDRISKGIELGLGKAGN